MLKASLRSFFAHKGRLALSGLAVALSVAFVVGTLILSDTIDATFTALFTSTAADVTVTPRQAFTPEVEDAGLAGPPATLSAATVAQVTGLPGVAAAHGQVIPEGAGPCAVRRCDSSGGERPSPWACRSRSVELGAA